MSKIDRGKLDDTLAAMFSNPDYRENYLFYAHMIGQCSIKIRDDIDAPAGVAFMHDHYNLFIRPERFDKYTLKERLFILQHEMHHILCDHVERREDRIPKPWNWAADCAINQLGNQDHIPENCITPDTLGKLLGKKVETNKSSEFYYDLLRDETNQEKCQDSNQCESDGNDSSGEPELLDDHSTWEECVGDKELQDDLTKKMLEKSQTETIKSKGKMPAAFDEWMEMFTRKSEVNWKKVLRGIVGNKRVGKRPTIMRKDRRFPNRPDLRGKTKDRVFNLLLVSDVSGSMSNDSVLATFAEVRHICDVTKTDCDLIQVDAQAYEPEKLKKKTKRISRKGFGGTMLFPAIEKARERNIDFQAVLVMTDGGVWKNDVEQFASLKKKVIWLIEPNGEILPEMNQSRMQAFKLKDQDAG